MGKTERLQRFVAAHREDYVLALTEIRKGRKESHWMWYIFPQLRGLGRSETAQYYAIEDLEEAVTFLNDSYLGKNLCEITDALLQHETNNASEIFGWPDDLKLRSSMTLFAYAAGENSVFHKVLEKYFDGQYDRKTEMRLAVDRIQKMEQIFDDLQAVKPDEIDRKEKAKEQLEVLKAYYEGGQWLADFELDEKGELPSGLKRGVLSQDGIYNLLDLLKGE